MSTPSQSPQRPSQSASSKFGPYTVGATLGKGSFGKVKAAVHNTTGHKVALKVISRKDIDALAEDGDAGKEKAARTRLKLLREIRTLRLLGMHPHITKLYDVVRTRSGDTVFVLELVDGGDLYEYLTTHGALSEDASRYFFQQLASAVATAHVFGVCHRDIKPENILMYSTPSKGAEGVDGVPEDEEASDSSSASSLWASEAAGPSDDDETGGGGSTKHQHDSKESSQANGEDPQVMLMASSAPRSQGARSPLYTNTSFPAIKGSTLNTHNSSQRRRRSKRPAYHSQGIKLGDFGLASVAHDGKLFETSCGTPNYAAPEVVSGRLYDGKEVDVWSCGVVLFTMITGSLPFDDEDLPSLFRKIQTGTFVFPDETTPKSEKERLEDDQKRLQQENQRRSSVYSPVDGQHNEDRLANSFGSEPIQSNNASPHLRPSPDHSSPLHQMDESHPYDGTPPLQPQPLSPFGPPTAASQRRPTMAPNPPNTTSGSSPSEAVKHLLLRMLCTDPLKRATMEEVLRHPWTMGFDTIDGPLRNNNYPQSERSPSAVPPYLEMVLASAKEEQQLIFPHKYNGSSNCPRKTGLNGGVDGSSTPNTPFSTDLLGQSTSPNASSTSYCTTAGAAAAAASCTRTESTVARQESEARMRARDSFRSLIDLDIVVVLCEKFRKGSRTIIDTLIHYDPATATQSKHPISGGEVADLARVVAASPRHTLVDHKLLRSANIFIPSADDALRSTEHDIIVSYSMLVEKKRLLERQRSISRWQRQLRREEAALRTNNKKTSWVENNSSLFIGDGKSGVSVGSSLSGEPPLLTFSEMCGATPTDVADDVSLAGLAGGDGSGSVGGRPHPSIKAPTLTMNVSLREGLMLLGKEERRAKPGLFVDPSSPEGRIRAVGGSFYAAPSYSDRRGSSSRDPPGSPKRAILASSSRGPSRGPSSRNLFGGSLREPGNSSVGEVPATPVLHRCNSSRFPQVAPKVQMTQLSVPDPATLSPASLFSNSGQIHSIHNGQSWQRRKTPSEALSQFISSPGTLSPCPDGSQSVGGQMGSFRLPPSSTSSCPLPLHRSMPVTPQSTQGMGPMFPPMGVSAGTTTSSNHAATPLTATTPQHGPNHFDPESQPHSNNNNHSQPPLPRMSLLHPAAPFASSPPHHTDSTPTNVYPVAPPGTLSLTLLQACGERDAFEWGALGQSVACLRQQSNGMPSTADDLLVESCGNNNNNSKDGHQDVADAAVLSVLHSIKDKSFSEQLPYHLAYYDQVNANQWLKALGLPHYALGHLPNPFGNHVDGLGRTTAPSAAQSTAPPHPKAPSQLITPTDESSVYFRLFNRVMNGLPYGIHRLNLTNKNNNNDPTTNTTETQLQTISDAARRIPLYSSGVLFGTTPTGAPHPIRCAQDVQNVVYNVLRRRGFLWKVLKPFQIAAISSPSGDGSSVYSDTLYDVSENESLRGVLFVPGEGPWPRPPPQTKLFVRVLKAPSTSSPLVCAGIASPQRKQTKPQPPPKAQHFYVVHVRLSDRCVADFASVALVSDLLDDFIQEATLRHTPAPRATDHHRSPIQQPTHRGE